MSLSDNEMILLHEACDKLGDGPSYKCNNYVANLMITVLDFQMNVKTANNAREYYKKRYHGDFTEPETLPELRLVLDKYPNTKEGNLQLANDMWDNNHWSRANFLRKFVECFDARGITDQASLEEWVTGADFEKDVKGQFRTENHSMGLAIFKWLQIRCGVDTIKPDVQVLKFIHKAINRKVDDEEAIESLMVIAKKSNRKAGLLDSAIWNFQKGRPST